MEPAVTAMWNRVRAIPHPARLVLTVVVGVATASMLASTEAKNASAAFPGRNGKIVFVRAPPGADPEGADIYVMNPDGSGRKQLTHNRGGEFILSPAWSPDGKRIAFQRSPGPVPGSDIVVMNADGSVQTNLTRNGNAQNANNDAQPAWSPDGRRIAFASYRSSAGNSEIYVMNTNGSGETNLTKNAAEDGSPVWSPNGRKIAFVRFVGASLQGEIFVMNADGSGQNDVSNNPASEFQPTWSPDGKKILFARSLGSGNSDVVLMNADGSGQTNLTKSSTTDFYPAWSPDGKKIVFSSGSPTITDDLYLMNADGSGVTKITNDRGVKNDLDPDWQAIANNGVLIPARDCSVPNVVGKPLRTAEKQIRKARFRVGKLTRKRSKSKLKNHVLSERPRAGNVLPCGAKVNLTVGRGGKR